ncbi:MAG: aspartate--tRNA ligase, partial [Planctomycetota bacterium]
YYQVARCFRDEDLRADRQPEFTQLDLEMSFVAQDDVFEAIEAMLAEVWAKVLGREVSTPFRRMSYDDAIRRFGIDKPDLRFELEIQDVTAIAAKTEASFLNGPAQHKGGRGERDGAVRALCVEGGAGQFSRKDLDALNDIVKIKGAGGVAWLKVGADGAVSGSVKKFFQGELGAELVAALSAKDGDLILMVADKNSDIAAAGAGALRLHVGAKLDLIDPKRDELLWVTDFPYFEYDAATGGYINCRHPFTKPREQDIPLLDTDPLKVHAIAYDLVLNGVELGSGSIRNHEPSLQKKVLEVMGYSAEESERRFGFLIEALRYGAPPHGGAALGMDRFAAELLGLSNLREVIAFPKTAKATCLLTHAPSTVDDEQLEVLAIQVVAEEEATAKVTV